MNRLGFSPSGGRKGGSSRPGGERLGFSLPETLLVLCLMGLLMTLAFQSVGDARPDSQAVAQEVTAQLRAARQKAQTHQQRVALVLPGPVARSVSVLEGSLVPRVTRTLRFDRQYPGARLVASPGTLDEPTRAWLRGYKDWPVVVFDQRGLASGTASIGVAGPTAWRVTVTPEGTVECARGAVTDPGTPPATALRVKRELDNTPPVIVKVDTAPDVAPNLLPDQVEAIIPKGGHITLKCLARDPEDDPLFAEWTSDKGVFSCQGWEPMNFDGTYWVSTAQFKPFTTLPTDTRLNIRVSVRDDAGLKAASGVDTVVTASIGMGGKLAFWGRPEGDRDAPVGLWICNPEGHNVRQLKSDVRAYATVSRDGTKIISGGPLHGVTICNLDGSDETPMYPAPYGFGVISPDGKSVAAFRMEHSTDDRLLLPPAYRQILPWAGRYYPTHIQLMTSNGVYTKTIQVPFGPGDVSQLTLPELVWSSDGLALFVITYTQEAGALREPKILAIRIADESVHPVPWPAHLTMRLHASVTPREVRATGNRTLEAIRWAEDYSTHRVLKLREWIDGGHFQTPAAFSPFDGLSTILCGHVVDGDNYSKVILALWPRGVERAHPLQMRHVEPFNDVITWTR